MNNNADRWDLTYLYKDFDDETFKADLSSLKEDAESGMALLQNPDLSPAERLEKLVAFSEHLSAKVDRLANFISCTQAVDATNEKANAAMDQLMMDVSNVPEAKAGDIVTMIGHDGNDRITADDLAQVYGTIGYEVVCGISKLVPRIYIE